jgi:hypothetical protein
LLAGVWFALASALCGMAVDDYPVPVPECLACCPAGAPPPEPGDEARTRNHG